MLVTLYNDEELFSFSNTAGLIYVRGLGNIATGNYGLTGGTVELGSRVFKVRRSTVLDVASSIERGPQAVTPKDVAFIGFLMDLSLEDHLLEIGGGNGAFSIIASILFNVKVISYEQNEENFRILERNIRRFEMDGRINALNADGLDADLSLQCCIFIDNPEPWNFLKDEKGGKMSVASILPTYSQAEEFSRFLLKKDFLVSVHQLVDVPHRLSRIGMRPESTILYHTGFIVSGKRW